ncbi:hypothetical protein GQ457_08G011950 [Hibiscus cannabinus]
MDLVLYQIWSGWMPSSSRRGSSSSKEPEPDAADVDIEPPTGPDDDGTDPISKAIKGMEDDGGREGWKGAVGTRRWLTFPAVPPPDGKMTGGTENSLVISLSLLRVPFWGWQVCLALCFLTSGGVILTIRLDCLLLYIHNSYSD